MSGFGYAGEEGFSGTGERKLPSAPPLAEPVSSLNLDNAAPTEGIEVGQPKSSGFSRGFVAGFASAAAIAGLFIGMWQTGLLSGGIDDESQGQPAAGQNGDDREIPEPRHLERRNIDRPDHTDVPAEAVPANQAAEKEEVGQLRATWQGSEMTSQPFARSVQSAYVAYVDDTGKLEGKIEAFSTVTGISYDMECTDEGTYIKCVGGNNAVVFIA